MGVDRMDFPEVVAKCNCTYDSHSLASSGTHRTPVDWLNYSSNTCFKPEDYVQDPQVMRLHIAARDNNTTSIKKSLERGVSVYQPDEVGRSALHWAAVFCKLDTVEAIIKRFPVSRLDKGDRNGSTPLHYAILAGRADVASMLLKAGCNMHSVDNEGRTPLHYAAQNSNAAVVSLLLKRGANPTQLDKLKRSPFDVAVEYKNTNKILESLRVEAASIISAPDKLKPIEHRQKQALMKTKAIETDGKLSLTFLSENQLAGEQTWQTEDAETEGQEVVVDRPVEIVKEEMERDAQRMKNKLRKIEGTKKPPSEEKKKVQQRALKLLLDRAKRNEMEKQRNKWAEEERLRRITQNRTRSTTPKTSPNPQSSVGMTPTGVTMGHFQTSRRPSDASSPLRETEELEPAAEDNGRQGILASCEAVLEDYFRIRPPAEFQTAYDTIVHPTESQAPEYASREAAKAADATFQQDRAEHVWHDQPVNGQESAIVSPTYFPAYVQQWFANAFSYTPVPPVMCKMWNPNAPAYTPDMYAEQSSHIAPSAAPHPNLEQRNFMGPSIPPPTYAEETNFNAHSVVRSADASQGNPRRPPSALFTYSEQSRSLASPESNANGPLDAMGSSIPPPTYAEATNFNAPSVLRSADASQGNPHRRPSLEQRNFIGHSIPPTCAEATSFNAPLVVRSADAGQGNSRRPPSPLFTYSEQTSSLASAEWNANKPLDAPTMGTVTEGSSAPATQLEQKVNYSADTSAPYDGERQTEIAPRNQDQQVPTEDTDEGLLSKCLNSILDLAYTPTENPEKLNGARSQVQRESSSQRYEQSGRSSQEVLRTESKEDEDEDEDLFTRLGYLHSHKALRGSFGTPPNRHGFECWTRPKARSQANKVRAGADHRWSQTQSPPKHPWSTDEPWRPGGISKTLEHSKIYGCLRRESKRNSIHSIRALIRRMQTQPLDDVDIDSDPFAKPEPKGDKEIDAPEHQHEALGSLRDKSRRPVDSLNSKSSPISQSRSAQKRRVMKFVPSQRANNLSSQYPPETCPHRKLADLSIPKKQRANTLTSRYLPETCPHRKLADSVPKTQENMDMEGRRDQAQRAITEQYQTLTDQVLQPSPVECQLDPFSQQNPSWQCQTNPLYSHSALQQWPMDLAYGQGMQQESQQPHPYQQSSSQLQAEFSPAVESNQRAQAFSYSTSSQLPQANISYPPNSCLQLHTMPPPYHEFEQQETIPFQTPPSSALSPQMLAAWLQQSSESALVDESQAEVCPIHLGDEFENRALKSSFAATYLQKIYQENEMERNQPKQRVVKTRSHGSSKRANSHCSVERFSPERQALMEYYGQSVRPQFLGLGREQAPVHQCLDVEFLQRQWL